MKPIRVRFMREEIAVPVDLRRGSQAAGKSRIAGVLVIQDVIQCRGATSRRARGGTDASSDDAQTVLRNWPPSPRGADGRSRCLLCELSTTDARYAKIPRQTGSLRMRGGNQKFDGGALPMHLERLARDETSNIMAIACIPRTDPLFGPLHC